MPASATESTTFAEFGSWYDDYVPSVLEPGLQRSIEAIERLLAETLTERDQVRIHRVAGRVKTKQRAWRKLRALAAGAPLPPLEDIPAMVHDLAGVRVTCTNLRDIEMVQEVLDTLPAAADRAAKPAGNQLWINRSKEQDYVLVPKESGYRGWHIGFGTNVEVDGRPVPVHCELQVRTLLQDTWGELTHVDTYSKDAALPALVSVLSTRMADLLATMDDIAEDLRTELDRVDEETVTVDRDPSPAPDLADIADVAGAEALLQARWRGLEQPLDLASLAWELRQAFGPEVSDEWFGLGSFKRLVRQAIPEAEFSTGRQQYLLPAEAQDVDPSPPGDDEGSTDLSAVPVAAERLRRIDRSLPLLEAKQWSQLFANLGAVWPEEPPSGLTARDINRLSKLARDRSERAGTPIPRRHFDYVVKAVLAAEDPAALPGAAELPVVFSDVILERMRSLRVLGEKNRKGRRLVRAWLVGGIEGDEGTNEA
ncbi:MAG: RelA/SpoT domain-containing protein [Acidimicrobiales bacterium]|nr:RelA/SpoT domain-containing protein [Acidimicrobiales bacterium]